MKKTVNQSTKHLSPVLGKYFPGFAVTRGRGLFLHGADGKRYLDFSSGIAVCATGHCHPRVVKAAAKQLRQLLHICIGVATYEPYLKLADKLAEILPIPHAQTFLCQSGAEAIEAAIKLAKYTTKKPGLVALKGGFHGRTLGALSLTTSKMKYRDGYEPLLPEVYIAEQTLDSVESLFASHNISGLVFEPILGEGGYHILPKDFIKGLRRLCTKYNVLMIADEIQSGMGRTGKWLAVSHAGVVPDVVCLSKGIASGLPLGAVVASANIMKNWSPGSHGGTFGGNPVSCAAAIATIEVIEKQHLLPKVKDLGKYLFKELKALQKKHPAIKDVRGTGLMIGIDFEDSAIVRSLIDFCLAHKLVIIPTGADGTVIRFIPALTVRKKEIDLAMSIFSQALLNA